ncbi:hypothetical protein RRG08_021645 [Elysia crispata]|uniref:Uncharacterized protein n=1 Tax=Elysia crispata TaxID=231223 RepID=A0AAE0XE37_9GAST|nr:hypothetical protein RRG08_021645 [Elysia crispata]
MVFPEFLRKRSATTRTRLESFPSGHYSVDTRLGPPPVLATGRLRAALDCCGPQLKVLHLYTAREGKDLDTSILPR